MSNIREVVLEILRHGSAHNQLLSPLTQYLVLCGSNPAVSVNVPFEHRILEYLLSRMSYPEGLNPNSEAARDRAHAREELSKAVTTLLESVPSLARESNAGKDGLLHLRLVTTPQELALLPFELAMPPHGFNNSGQPLLIGPEPDVVLTREVRRSSDIRVRIPTRPKVLLAIASPGNGEVPRDEVTRKLAEAMRPWMGPVRNGNRVELDIANLITVLPHASLDEIRAHCATGAYSHVHILAHGAELTSNHSQGYGISLCQRNNKLDAEIVDGPTLARAIRPPNEDGGWSSPWCVVLTVCDSGSVGGVLHPNASIAHALHIAGVPFVVASQYPLTFGAAIKLTESFYPMEMRGEDPRRTLRDVRHAIATHMRETHDWASVVAYAGWPSNLQKQIDQVRLARLLEQLEAAQAWADTVTAGDENARNREEVLTNSKTLVTEAVRRLEREAKTHELSLASVEYRNAINEISKPERQHLRGEIISLLTEIYGLLGSANKRLSKLCMELEKEADSLTSLREACDWYVKGARLQAPEHWTNCQAFVIQALVSMSEGGNEKLRKEARDNWRLAYEAASRDHHEEGGRIWAFSTLIEVALWRPFFELGESANARQRERANNKAIAEATGYLHELQREAGPRAFPVQSTVRQLRRYTDWWGKSGYLDDDVLSIANKVLDERLFTEEDRETDTNLNIDLPHTLDSEIDRAVAQEMLGDGKVKVVDLEDEGTHDYFSVEMLPARQGDALWIEYGDEKSPSRFLIDGGFRTTVRVVTERIEKLAAQSDSGFCHFELGVVSHIDADHIEGIIEILSRPLPVSFGDLWFNGRKHLDVQTNSNVLQDHDLLGGKHGLFLDTALELTRTRWNQEFNGGPVVLPDGGGDLPVVKLDNDMTLTLFSPTHKKLDDLAKRWDREVRKAGLDGANAEEVLAAMSKLHYGTGAYDSLLGRKRPSGELDIEMELQKPDGADESPANGSSIAFLAEHRGRSCLFMADAHPDVMVESIIKHVGPDNRLNVGAIKLSHHGSGNNVTLGLLKRVNCQVFLVSTNGGGGHYHPDRHAMAKLLAGDWRPRSKEEYPITVLFNYRNEFTRIWDDAELQDKHNYRVHFADSGDILALRLVPKPPEE